MYLAAAVLVLGGIAVGVVALRARADRLPRQGFAGVRTRMTMRSDTTWYAAQRAAAPWMLVTGAALTAAGLVILLLRPAEEDGLTIAMAGALVAGLAALVAVLAGSRAAHHAAADEPPEGTH